MTAEAEEQKSAWETETGLPNDIDAWIANAKFGQKDEYAKKIQEAGGIAGEGLMFLVDLIDETGQLVGSQGWSVGSGWIVSDDGMTISHPKRKNVVGSSLYGQLQTRVVKVLKVGMDGRGKPTEAKSWDGLGFHWMLEEHDTVAGPKASAIMPTEFLGEKKGIAVAAPAAAPPTEIEAKLTEIVKASPDAKEFQKVALKIAEVVANDDLMAKVLDDGPSGFYQTHKG